MAAWRDIALRFPLDDVWEAIVEVSRIEELQWLTELELLRWYVRQNLDEFVDLQQGGIEDTSGHDHRACPGYVNKHNDHGLEFFFSDWRFEQIVGGAVAAKRLKAELAKRGWLDTAAGTGGDRHSVRRTIGRGADGKGHGEQVVAVRAAAFNY